LWSAVGDLAGTVATAVGVFAGTNVDDLIVLTVLFLSSRASGKPARWQIWVGQYAGIGTLVAVSAAAALGLTIVPDRWVGLLGIVPFALGVRAMVRSIRAQRSGDTADSAGVVASTALSVAAVTVANGADNIAVYTPMFRTIGPVDSLVTVVVFALLTALWCAAGGWLGGHRRVIAAIGRYGRWLVPTVFMAIGAVIVLESGVLDELV
jgi:cadmium resistance transport/sequestration family protein